MSTPSKLTVAGDSVNIGSVSYCVVGRAITPEELALVQRCADAEAAREVVAPAGFKLVPVEPTFEMVKKAMTDCMGMGVGSCGEYSGIDSDDMRAVYQAMLEAAPTTPAASAGVAEANVDYAALEGPLEELVRLCNNDDMLSNASEVIAAEAALETVHRARLNTAPQAEAPARPQPLTEGDRRYRAMGRAIDQKWED